MGEGVKFVNKIFMTLAVMFISLNGVDIGVRQSQTDQYQCRKS